MYLEVMPSGAKLWRMKFMQASGKESRFSFGRYPEFSLAQARAARFAIRQQKAAGIDPTQARRDAKRAKLATSARTFELLAREWLKKAAADRTAGTQEKNTSWLERNIFPQIGRMPIATITPRHVLLALQKIEARGAITEPKEVAKLLRSIDVWRPPVRGGGAQAVPLVICAAWRAAHRRVGRNRPGRRRVAHTRLIVRASRHNQAHVRIGEYFR